MRRKVSLEVILAIGANIVTIVGGIAAAIAFIVPLIRDVASLKQGAIILNKRVAVLEKQQLNRPQTETPIGSKLIPETSVGPGVTTVFLGTQNSKGIHLRSMVISSCYNVTDFYSVAPNNEKSLVLECLPPSNGGQGQATVKGVLLPPRYGLEIQVFPGNPPSASPSNYELSYDIEN